jgi:hypothetical protein
MQNFYPINVLDVLSNLAYPERCDKKKDERCCDENSCTQIVDEPLNLFMGKINQIYNHFCCP